MPTINICLNPDHPEFNKNLQFRDPYHDIFLHKENPAYLNLDTDEASELGKLGLNKYIDHALKNRIIIQTTGYGAILTATIDSGEVTDVSIDAVGMGYEDGNLVVDNTGSGGTGFAGTYTVNEYGGIDEITISNGGSGYTSEPTITPTEASDDIYTVSSDVSVVSVSGVVTIAGAVTNAILTAVFDGIDSLRVAVQNTVTVANSVLTNAYNAGATALNVMLVDSAGDEKLSIGADCLKPLTNPTAVQVPAGDNPVEHTLQTGAQKIWFSNPSTNTATFYIGINDSVDDSGKNCIPPGYDMEDFEVNGLTSIWIYADVDDEYISITEFGR